MAEGLTQRRANGGGAAAAAASTRTVRVASPTSPSSSSSASLFSANASKARGEKFFLGWGAVWISIMATIVATRWFEVRRVHTRCVFELPLQSPGLTHSCLPGTMLLGQWFTGTHYMITGLIIALPPMILPFLFPGPDAAIPWHQRYTTKANVWIFILSWVANYFWTHYFYHVLGASYTFQAWRLNDVSTENGCDLLCCDGRLVAILNFRFRD
jgi:hypothetical protein